MNTNKPLSGIKAAILVANGFCEQDMTEAQRALMEAGANVRIVSPENGLVNSWDGQGWGHHFAVDSVLNTALGADFHVLVLPGGSRSHDKLKLTAHTKRFVSSFMAANKPVFAIGDALALLVAAGGLAGRTVTGSEAFHNTVIQAGASWSDSSPCCDGNLMTAFADNDTRRAAIADMVRFFADGLSMKQAA